MSHQSLDGVTFTLSAAQRQWVAMVRGEFDPVAGLVLGRIRVQGQLSSVLRRAAAFRHLIRVAGQMSTTFPDEG